LPNFPYPFNHSTHLSLPNAANSDLLLPSSLIAANNDPCGKKLPTAIFRCNLFISQPASLPTILIAASNKLNTTAAVSHSIPLLPSSATVVYIAALSSSYCSRTLAATDATCSHEVPPQPQPTLLLPSSSSAIAAAFRLRSLGCHLPTNISHLKNRSLDDIVASTLQHHRRTAADVTAILRTFIEGLKPEIQEEVKERQSYTLKAAISFARHQEERLNYEARKIRVAPRPAAPKLSPPPTVSRPPQP
ncbi:hypothetical protein B296_00046644, partial [Ensete ventricosum]